MALSLRRANAVKDALVREGVPAQAISGGRPRRAGPAGADRRRRARAAEPPRRDRHPVSEIANAPLTNGRASPGRFRLRRPQALGHSRVMHDHDAPDIIVLSARPRCLPPKPHAARQRRHRLRGRHRLRHDGTAASARQPCSHSRRAHFVVRRPPTHSLAVMTRTNGAGPTAGYWRSPAPRRPPAGCLDGHAPQPQDGASSSARRQGKMRRIPLPKLAIEPAFKLERALSFGWIRGGKRGLGAVRFDVVNDGARALNDAPGILEHRYESARRHASNDWSV